MSATGGGQPDGGSRAFLRWVKPVRESGTQSHDGKHEVTLNRTKSGSGAMSSVKGSDSTDARLTLVYAGGLRLWFGRSMSTRRAVIRFPACTKNAAFTGIAEGILSAESGAFRACNSFEMLELEDLLRNSWRECEGV